MRAIKTPPDDVHTYIHQLCTYSLNIDLHSIWIITYVIYMYYVIYIIIFAHVGIRLSYYLETRLLVVYIRLKSLYTLTKTHIS